MEIKHQNMLQFCTCHNSSAFVACANLWPDMIIIIKIKAMRILMRFQLWAHKPSVKCAPGILIRGNLAGFPVFLFTEEIGSSGSWQLGFSHRHPQTGWWKAGISGVKTEWGLEIYIISTAKKVNGDKYYISCVIKKCLKRNGSWQLVWYQYHYSFTTMSRHWVVTDAMKSQV